MIRADELVVDQVYYVAIAFEVVTRTYIGTIPGNDNQQPVYIFADTNRKPFKQYGIDLLIYFSVEADALQLVKKALIETLDLVQTRLDEFNIGSQLTEEVHGKSI